ncbi:MAG: hypothetical protein M3N08_10400, partial [Pseudomonadota bacterium]|nr:hypothetical protein [Pseudomonadota bacterium]
MDECEYEKIGNQVTDWPPRPPPKTFFNKGRNRARAGFAIAPILYMLGLVGVGAAVLFSGYSQVLRTNVN